MMSLIFISCFPYTTSKFCRILGTYAVEQSAFKVSGGVLIEHFFHVIDQVDGTLYHMGSTTFNQCALISSIRSKRV